MIMPSSLDLSELPSLCLTRRAELPKTAAIYFAIDSLDQVQYIGRSVNLRQRWSNHHQSSALDIVTGVRIAWLEISERSLLHKIEQALIEYFDPPLNGVKTNLIGASQPKVRSITIPLTKLRKKKGRHQNDLAKLTGYSFQYIRADGYWSATEMCQTYNKRLDDFLRLDSIRAYLKAFEKLKAKFITTFKESETGSQQELGKRESEESETGSQQELNLGLKSAISQTRGGRGKQGTWVHPQLALKLAAWLNPEFEVWVYATIEKLFTQGEVKLKDELAGLRSALSQATESIDKYDAELALSQYKQTQLKREYLAAVCLSHWEGDYSDYSEDPDCYQTQKIETKH